MIFRFTSPNSPRRLRRRCTAAVLFRSKGISSRRSMFEKALRAFAKEHFGDVGDFYPVYQGVTNEIQLLALLVKENRSVLVRPFKRNSLIPLAGLEKYVTGSKKDDFRNAVIRKHIVKEDRELYLNEEEDDMDEDEARSDLEAGVEVANAGSARIKISQELGDLVLGKIDREYIRDLNLRVILNETELDSTKTEALKDRKLRLITSVVYSERFKLTGRRRYQVEVAGEAQVPVNQVVAKLKGYFKRTVIPPNLAKREARAPILFTCCRVVFNEKTNKLELPQGDFVATARVRSMQEVPVREDEYENTAVCLGEGETDLADSFTDEYGDGKKLDIIKESVLMPTKNRGERKARINKYLSWFEKALRENQKNLVLDEPLDDADCRFLRSAFVTAHPNTYTVDLKGLFKEIEKIQGYVVILKILAGLSDAVWDEVEKAWEE